MGGRAFGDLDSRRGDRHRPLSVGGRRLTVPLAAKAFVRDGREIACASTSAIVAGEWYAPLNDLEDLRS